MMAKENDMAKQIVKCINCGREISGVNAAKNDGWIFQEDGKTFCCCVCIGEYGRKEKTGKKKKN